MRVSGGFSDLTGCFERDFGVCSSVSAMKRLRKGRIR